jgi:hypothetical protein
MRDLRSVFALVPLASFSNSTNQGSAGLTQVWSWTWALVRPRPEAREGWVAHCQGSSDQGSAC